LYVDSEASDFFISNGGLSQLCAMTRRFLDGVIAMLDRDRPRMRNVPLAGLEAVVPEREEVPQVVTNALEVVEAVQPPGIDIPFQFNIDYSDFVSDI
jgi:hypothetical protein